MISKREVEHIAKLARIKLSVAETKKFQKELADVLEYFEVLGEIDVSGIAPMTHSVPLLNIKRKDVAKPKSAQQRDTLVEMAPDTKERFIKVKAIL